MKIVDFILKKSLGWLTILELVRGKHITGLQKASCIIILCAERLGGILG